MAHLNRFAFLAIAVVFHLIYLYSIFDIYFVSPIVAGVNQFRVERPHGVEAPSRRLVLYVGDGLRADKAFQSFPDPSPADPADPAALKPRPLMPFLRQRILKDGTFGVSHTRMPTESRPGHVALIAGLYEDVSAVTTGWKLNPVNFDSVFNRSRHTWSWGSPDILPMFKEGAVPGRIDADFYAEEFEDYTLDATQLDTWVFDRVEALFAAAASNATLDAALREDKLVFFLHLLGLDTTGHAYRPYSREYLHNIKIVDQGVQNITRLIDKFYGDGKTSYIFTADHGMSDWGSHGDGHPDNTRTPLIAWGAGVAKPVTVDAAQGKAAGHEDGFSFDWGLHQIQRNDVSQADVAALMAYLAGLDFPANSVGELPLAYVAGTTKEKAEAAFVNAQSIMEMYRVKEERKKSTELRYRPFPPLGGEQRSAHHRIAEIRQLIDAGQEETAIANCIELMKLGLEGLRYLQTYDWLFLRALVTAGYLGWIAFALTSVVDAHVLHGDASTSRTTGSTTFFASVLVALYSFLWVQKSSWTYFAYALFPVVFWEEVYVRRRALVAGRQALLGHVHTVRGYLNLGIKALAFVGLLEAMVQGYHQRQVFSVCFVLAAFWPALHGRDFIVQNRSLMLTWGGCCFLMSTFTLLPVVKVEDVTLILLGGALMFAVGALYLLYEKSIVSASNSKGNDGISRSILGAQVGLIALAMVVTRSSALSLQSKQGLPLGNQVVGWIVLGQHAVILGEITLTKNAVTSLAIPFLHGLQPKSHYLHRLVIIFLTFSPIFIILTISYEGLFYFTFCATLVTWVRLEHQLSKSTSKAARTSPHATPTMGLSPLAPALAASATRLKALQRRGDYRALTLDDARIALFFLFLLQSAFFSTGNIASISSFSLDSVYRLIPVFNPFSQGALLVLKLLIPFALISANLGILNRRLGMAPSAIFMVVMAVGDVLTLNFFWMVRDEGSWLDIGTSISHFCIASLLCVFVAVLEAGSEVFVSGVDVDVGEMVEEGESGPVEVGKTDGAITSNGSGGIGGTSGKGRKKSSKANGRK
ncbi:MAG: Glycosyl phosphatidyl inositol anchor synthesis [Thelocarpon superellum]|nr:MAG: Glycosyl phosphatidyl inositol anchor synthesis [Thelocarpon superellum]